MLQLTRGANSVRLLWRDRPTAADCGCHGHCRARQAKRRPVAAAAASADISAPPSPEQLIQHAVPYLSRSAPKLQSRSMVGSPADGIWSAVTAAILRLELLSAATVDRHAKIGPLLMSGLAAGSVGMGVDAWTLLRHGLPPYFQDTLFATFGAWDTTLWVLGLTAVAAPVAAWALRAWWVSSVLLLSVPGGALQQLQQAIKQQQQGSIEQHQQPEEATAGSWLAGSLTLLRGFFLASAISSVSRALYSSSTTGRLVGSAAALGAVILSAAPVALVLRDKQQQTAAVSLLAAEAAYVVAMVGLAPIANAAAAAVLSAALWSLHQQLVMPRLLRFQASEGDGVEVHVSLKVAGTEAVFDSTLTADPLKIVAAKQDPEYLQAWKELSPNVLWDEKPSSESAEQTAQQQQQQQTADATTTSSSSDSSFAVTGSVRDITENIQSWMSEPEARWESLQPFAAEAACGMFLGETRAVRFFNPKGVGYWNPRFSWWQPKADVAEKFKGEMPNPGDVFWYPVSEEAYVQTRVTSMGDTHVELDANYGVTGTHLQMDVQLVRLHKQ